MRASAAVFVAMLLVGTVLADEIKKKDGVKIEGTIVKEDDDTITIRNDIGDITVKKKDVALVNGKAPANLEDDLDKVKRDACVKLEELAQQAERQGKDDVAKKLRAYLDSVKGWDLKPEKKVDKPEKQKATTEDEKLDRVRKGEETFSKFAERWKSIREDKSFTDVQRKRALDALKGDYNGKKILLGLRIKDVREESEGDILIDGSSPVSDWTWTGIDFRDKRDCDRLRKMSKDAVIFFEATIVTKAYSYDNEPGVSDFHMR